MAVAQQNLTLEKIITLIQSEVSVNPGIIEKSTYIKLPQPTYSHAPDGKIQRRGYSFGIKNEYYEVHGENFLTCLEKSDTLKHSGSLPVTLYKLSARELLGIAPCGERVYKQEPIMELMEFYEQGAKNKQNTAIKELYEFVENQFNSYFSSVAPRGVYAKSQKMLSTPHPSS